MVNYVMGVSFNDSFRFTIVQLEEKTTKIYNQVFMLFKLGQNEIKECFYSTLVKKNRIGKKGKHFALL